MVKILNYRVITILLLSICLGGISFFSPKSAAENQAAYQIMQQVEMLEVEERYVESKIVLEEAVQAGHQELEIIKKLVRLYNKLFLKYDKSVQLLLDLIEEQPDQWEFYQLLGKTYLYKQQASQAVSYLERAVRLFPDQEKQWNHPLAELKYDLAAAFLQIGEQQKAVRALEQTVKADPFHLKGSNLLHRLYVQRGEYEQAYSVWEKNNQVFPGLQDPNRFKEWKQLYKDGLAEKDSNRHYSLAQTYYRLLLYDEAETELKKALTEEPDNQKIQDMLKEVSLLLDFRDRLQSFFDNYYRNRFINGVKEEKQIYARLAPIYSVVAPLFPQALHLSDQGWINQLNRLIEEKFNLKVKIYQANGALICTSGSIVSRHEKKVSLWGKETELNVLIIKNLITNGRNYWLSDGQYGIGGWNSNNKPNEIKLLADSSYQISEIMEDYYQLKKELAKDEAAYQQLFSRVTEELYYEGAIQRRLIFRELETRLQQYAEEGTNYSEKAFQQVGMSLLASNYHTSLITHEGQHALDSMSGNYYTSAEKEYRAKLAELILGSQQYLTLGSIFNANIGSSNMTSHARAENMLFSDLVSYLAEDGEQYPEIDLTKNILAQLPQLSREQIRELAREIFLAKYPL